MPDNDKNRNRLTWSPQNIFSGTAWYYSRYRPGYPDKVINLLKEKYRLTDKSRVLDLGCGTGQAALEIAPYVSEVVALDPQEEMLKEGQQLAVTKRIPNIKWLIGESGDFPCLSSRIGEVNLTVIARAFHWMNGEQILRDLYGITKPGGGVAIIVDSGPRDGTKLPWKEIIDQTVKRWLGEERKAGTGGTYSHPTKRFETVLKESAFGDLEIATFQLERSWSIDGIIGYLYSTSSSSLPVLGPKRESFESDIRTRLREFEPTGQFREQVTIEIMMVWKPLLQAG